MLPNLTTHSVPDEDSALKNDAISAAPLRSDNIFCPTGAGEPWTAMSPLIGTATGDPRHYVPMQVRDDASHDAQDSHSEMSNRLSLHEESTRATSNFADTILGLPRPLGTSDHTSDTVRKQCSLCCKTFGKQKSLLRHQRTAKCIGQTKSEVMTCSLCDETFSRKENYQRHVDFQHGVDKIQCNHCGRTVAARSMVGHQRTRLCSSSSAPSRHLTAAPRSDTATTRPKLAIPRISSNWQILDPWRMIWSVFTMYEDAFDIQKFQSTYLGHGGLLSYLVEYQSSNAFLQKWRLDDALALKVFCLQICRKRLSSGTADVDTYHWLQCLTVLSGILNDTKEAITHDNALDVLHHDLCSRQGCPYGILPGYGRCLRCPTTQQALSTSDDEPESDFPAVKERALSVLSFTEKNEYRALLGLLGHAERSRISRDMQLVLNEYAVLSVALPPEARERLAYHKEVLHLQAMKILLSQTALLDTSVSSPVETPKAPVNSPQVSFIPWNLRRKAGGTLTTGATAQPMAFPSPPASSHLHADRPGQTLEAVRTHGGPFITGATAQLMAFPSLPTPAHLRADRPGHIIDATGTHGDLNTPDLSEDTSVYPFIASRGRPIERWRMQDRCPALPPQATMSMKTAGEEPAKRKNPFSRLLCGRRQRKDTHEHSPPTDDYRIVGHNRYACYPSESHLNPPLPRELLERDSLECNMLEREERDAAGRLAFRVSYNTCSFA